MIIACTIDTRYIRHCAVMLRSLRESNPDADLSVYIVHSAVDPAERARLAAYLGDFLPCVSFIQIDPELLAGFPVFGHISVATYFRLLLPAALPHAVEKVIFLDSDMIVVDSLRDLWQVSLEDRPLAAVPDQNPAIQASDPKRLGLAPGSRIFNAGVMLMNLSLWRRNNILSRGLAYASTHADTITYWDQDVLNHLLEGEWLPLDWRWNALPSLWICDDYADPATAEGQRAKVTTQNPAIIHFAGSGPGKPWHHGCPHPWRHRYRELAHQSPWAHVRLEDAPPPLAVRWRRDAIFHAKTFTKGVLTRMLP